MLRIEFEFVKCVIWRSVILNPNVYPELVEGCWDEESSPANGV